MTTLAGNKTHQNNFIVHVFCIAPLEMAFMLLLQENRRALRRERVFRDRKNPLDSYDDTEMYSKYRFTRLGCIILIDLFAEGLEHPTKRNKALPWYLQVFVDLR